MNELRPKHRRPVVSGQPKLGEEFLKTEVLASRGAESTSNEKGFSFSKLDEYVRYWVNSLPQSKNPLADLGAGIGYQTCEALRLGRDVIAIDREQSHLSKLSSGAASVVSNNNPNAPVGRLIDTRCTTLPDKSVLPPASIAGVLLSEVLHFMKPGQPLQLLRDVHEWLEPGGRVVVTVCAPAALERWHEFGVHPHSGRNVDEVWHILEHGSDDLIVKEAPTFAKVQEDSILRSVIGSSIYPFSTNQLAALARLTGFQVDLLSYFSSDKYPLSISDVDNVTVLVATKV